MRMRNTIEVISVVPKATCLSWAKFSWPLAIDSSVAPSAPMAAASVGVA